MSLSREKKAAVVREVSETLAGAEAAILAN